MFLMLAFWLVLILYVLTCGLLIIVILSQEGTKGGGLTGGLGTTAGETFGFSSATETFRRFTRILATVFIVLSIGLTYLGNRMVNRNASRLIAAPTAVAPAPADPLSVTTAPAAEPTPVPDAAQPAPSN
jgi:preprotein translocase subunit SecG